MLEVRYNKITLEITGWCGDSNQFGNLKDRGNEEILILDISIPPKSCWNYIFENGEVKEKI